MRSPAVPLDDAALRPVASTVPSSWRRYEWGAMVPFWLAHVIPFAAIATGVSARAAVLCAVLYVVRMFAVTAGYHRYFSHRTFKTSRWFQLVLAVVAQSSAQRGALWWASHHRRHHRYSDQPADVHSPIQHGFWHAHFLWIYDHNDHTELKEVRDLTVYPELVWLDRYFLVPALALGVLCFLVAGWSGLVIGFFLSTVLLWHGTFTINSLTHVIGTRRFETPDGSRNHWFLALLTLGEGWHNNHHYFQSSVRQGFVWWEFDPTYYALKLLSYVGVVWDLKGIPERVQREVLARSAGQHPQAKTAQ